MKKTVLCIISALLIFAMISACSQSEVQSESESTTSQSQTSENDSNSAEQTTLEETSAVTVNEDDEKGENLEKTIKSTLNDDYTISGESQTGSFEVVKNDTDSLDLYANEASDEYEEKAKENAESFIESIAELYPYDITYSDCETEQVGSSENGIDSTIYKITYKNKYNQQILIQADSSSNIYYIKCNFTW